MPVSTKVQVRRDTAANWTSTNPTLASGEIGFETDTLKFKIGNGSTAWNSLAYQNASTSAQNYAQTLGTKTLVTTGATLPFSVVSVSITTSGGPVLVMVSGDAENATAGTWIRVQLYRGSTAIGNDVQLEGSAASENSAYAIQFVDAQAAGTYTYHLRVTNIAGGNFNFGENTGPVITAIELNSLAGSAGSVSNTVTGTNSADLVYGNMADNDQFRIRIGGTATNAGFVEIATADDGTEPIHVRQYTGVFSSLARTATLLDGSGNTTFPGTVSGTRFISNVSTGTAPFTVSSTTMVTNLNADFVDGYSPINSSTPNTIVLRDASQNFAANTITANLFGTANLATYIVGGAAGSLPYQNAANTTTYLARTATNNSTLAFNSSTDAPFWIQPTLSNTYYAATTSAQLAGVVSDETGTGNLVFSTSPTFTTPRLANSTTTATAGLRDFDGTVFYSTTTTTPGKALDVASYYYVSSAQYAIDATTGAFTRSLLGGSNTGITVDAGTTYEYEGLFVITGFFVATSQTPTINLNSTTVTLSPVVAHQTVVESGNNATGLGSASALSAYRFISGGAGIALTALTTGSRYYTVKMRGRIAVTGTGTAEIQPTIRFSQGSTDNEWTVESGAIFRMTPIGNGTVTTVGTWA